MRSTISSQVREAPGERGQAFPAIPVRSAKQVVLDREHGAAHEWRMYSSVMPLAAVEMTKSETMAMTTKLPITSR